MEFSPPKFYNEKTISLNSEIHADPILYLDSAQLSKVFGLFQISFSYFCVEIFSSHGTEMSKLLNAMVNYFARVWQYHIVYCAESERQSDFKFT
jgi:hypothetical protein